MSELEIANNVKKALENNFSNIEMALPQELTELKFNAATMTGYINLPPEISGISKDKDNNTVNINEQAVINVFINTNPYGVTGTDDIERTININIEMLGTQQDNSEGEKYNKYFAKLYTYVRAGEDRNITEQINHITEEIDVFYTETIELLSASLS